LNNRYSEDSHGTLNPDEYISSNDLESLNQSSLIEPHFSKEKGRTFKILMVETITKKSNVKKQFTDKFANDQDSNI
jgi:hypothetical protein